MHPYAQFWITTELQGCLTRWVVGLFLVAGSQMLIAGGNLETLIETVRDSYRSLPGEMGLEAPSPAVVEALQKVFRPQFMPEAQRQHGWEDRPLPIGYGQTISQPSIVAMMTDLLQIESGDKVLEVGTGSGYQAAILAEVGAEVYSIEIIEALADKARERLQRLGYGKVHLRTGDGYHGWPKAAPFDGILVTAAASHVPPPLVEQLKPGGRMVIPVGGRFTLQYLMLVEKQVDGSVTTRQLLPVIFVPLTGKH